MAYRIPPPGQPISLVDIQNEFGGDLPIGIDEYYGVDDGVPVSGTISLNDFYGTGGDFVWCAGDMTNVVVGVDVELSEAARYMNITHHGEHTTLFWYSPGGTVYHLVANVVNDDGTISSFVESPASDFSAQELCGLNDTEGYVYRPLTSELSKYTLDTSIPELVIIDPTSYPAPPPSNHRLIGMRIIREFSDGVQFVLWTFDQEYDTLTMRAYLLRNDVLTVGDPHVATGDFDAYYSTAQAHLDGFFLIYGRVNSKLYYVDEVDNTFSMTMDVATSGDDNFNLVKDYTQVAGRSVIVTAEHISSNNNIQVQYFRQNESSPLVTEIPANFIDPLFDGMFLKGSCLVISGYDPTNPKKKKLLRSTLGFDSISEFTTLYLQPDESPVVRSGMLQTRTGIQGNGNKWLFSTKDEATGNLRLSSLTVDPYIIPDPPSGLPTLWMTDNNEGATEPTLQSFDVSDSENGNVTHLASVLPADLSDDRLGAMLIDSARNIGFFGNAASSSMMYAVDLSVPDDSTNWIIGQVLVVDSYTMDINSMALNIADNLVYAGGSASKEMFTVDVSDPANMTVIGSDNLSNSIRQNMVFDQTKKILYTGTDDKIYAYDPADPANVVKLAEYAHPTLIPFKGDIVLDTERDVLIAGSDEGLGYLDLSDLATWEYLPLFDDTECWGIYLAYDQTNKIAIGTTDFDSSGAAVFRFDLSDLVTPALFTYNTNGSPMRPSVDPDKMIAYIPLPDGDTGIEVLDYSTTLVSVVVFPVDMMQEFSALSSS